MYISWASFRNVNNIVVWRRLIVRSRTFHLEKLRELRVTRKARA